jgi:DNA-binding winged helix-turn-helix (wHTH) protein/TolB-like protein
MDTDRVFVFAPYRLEVGRGRLLRDDQPVPLTPKAFDVLLALIERRDRVVDKAELMKVVWPDSFVEEANLSQTIFVLRKTLGDGPAGQVFIETVPRRGYRFAADVTEQPAAVAASAPNRTPKWRERRRAMAVAIAVGAVAALAIWRLWPDQTASGSLADGARIVVLPFENLTGNHADDWLAGAFSDALTTGLQNVERLVPVNRDRVVELYRGQGLGEAAAIDAGALRRVTDALRVRYYVHGSYQKFGDQIKVSARVVASDSGAIELQDSVTDNFANLLKVEDELAARLAQQLQSGARSVRAGSQTSSLEAYKAFNEGRTLYALTRYEDGVEPLTRATTLDPQYAAAWALRAKNQARLATITMISSGTVSEIRRAALDDAKRAVALAPALYDAQIALSLANRELEDVEQWRAHALKAIELNAQLAEAHELIADSYFAGNAWGCRRDRNAALAEQHFEKAILIDPLWAAPYANLSYHLSWSDREADALRVAEQGLAQLPSNPTITRARALALARLGRSEEAEEAIRQILGAGAAMSAQDHVILGSVGLSRGETDAAAREFATAAARLPTTATFLAIARGYLDAHALETGLSYLDRTVTLESACAQFAAATPAFAPYRELPQFRARLSAWR